jgi:hypothetical protein
MHGGQLLIRELVEQQMRLLPLFHQVWFHWAPHC